MIVVNGSDKYRRDDAPSVLCMGNFDGVHLGHQKILKAAVDAAKECGGRSVLYTFDPHPVKIIAPESAPKLIQTEAQKAAAIGACGIDVLVVENFTKDYAEVEPQDFFSEYIIKRIAPTHIVVGYDFTFGFHRHGTVETLRDLGRANNIGVSIVDAVFDDDTLISSSQIRKFIGLGNIEGANKLLGRPYSIAGVVEKGRGLGGEIGVHTANLDFENELIPAEGVYITQALGKKAVTNIGPNPTFAGNKLTIETHILDYSGKLYGKKLEVEFFAKIRDEIKFGSADELKKQIEKDIKIARKY